MTFTAALSSNGLKIVTRTVELLPPVCNSSNNPGSKLPFMIAMGLDPRGGINFYFKPSLTFPTQHPTLRMRLRWVINMTHVMSMHELCGLKWSTYPRKTDFKTPSIGAGHMPSVKLQRMIPSWLVDKPPPPVVELKEPSFSAPSSSTYTDDSPVYPSNDSSVSDGSKNVSSSSLDLAQGNVLVDEDVIFLEDVKGTARNRNRNIELKLKSGLNDYAHGRKLDDDNPLLQCYGYRPEDLDPSENTSSLSIRSLSDFHLSTPGWNWEVDSYSSSSSDGRDSLDHFHHIELKPGDLDWNSDQNSHLEDYTTADDSRERD